MSGFDFGGLRDPDAPQPDSHHRDAVEVRAHELRSKERRNRTLLSGLAVVVVVAAVAAIITTRPDGDHVIVRNPSSTTTAPHTTSSSIDGRFIPPTTTEHGITTLPVTLPDGETFTMRYGEKMRIAQLGFAGGIGVSNNQAGIRYTTVARVYGAAKPVAVYRGASGENVPLFHSSQELQYGGDTVDYLAFQFGPWLVQVGDVAAADRGMWARNLTGSLDANGYLLLHARAPLNVSSHFEGLFGSPVSRANQVELASSLYCGQPESDSSARRTFVNGDGSHGVSWCDGDLHVAVTGSQSFVDLAGKLEVSPLGTPLTYTSPSTTTTTQPAPTYEPALSASFISPRHGLVLQRNGEVAETTDGGMSWNALGSVGPIVEDYTNPQIRFSDRKRGFVHIDSKFLTTVDGGAHWQRSATPFGRVSNLAISRGVVYLVAYDKKANNFALWSSPVDQLAWAKDPLTLPIGAGPVPLQQLVFSGGNGWVINGDRGVSGGARLSASGHWEIWNPPCRGAYAWLAASSATDIAASCEEGVWTGPKITHSVYVSHDAGASFQRHVAPFSGPVASADSRSVIVATSDGLQRTTDEGASWQLVAAVEPGYSAFDLGFTTSTQGFVIFQNGPMLMTYDAGATWSAVTLP